MELSTKTKELKQLITSYISAKSIKSKAKRNCRLKKIAEIQSFIELSNLNYSTGGNNYNFSKYLLPPVLLNNLYDGSLTLQDGDRVQSLFAN